MTTVRMMRERVRQLYTGLEDVAIEAIDQTAEQLLDKQQDQMLHGLRPDGTKIGEYRNEQYAAMKHAMNPMAGFGNVDVRLTGAFYAAEHVNVLKDVFIIESEDEKAEKLTEQYGDFLGIGGEFKDRYVEEDLQPALQKETRKILKV